MYIWDFALFIFLMMGGFKPYKNEFPNKIMLRKYYDLHVATKHSYGVNTVEEVVRTAEKLGLDTIVILDAVDSIKDLEEIKKEVKSVESNVNVLVGVDIKAQNQNDLHKKINRFRDVVDLLAVSGGELEINRSAVESPKVDLLIHPELKRKDSGMDYVMMKLASENKVAIELNFREYLHSYRRIRSYVLAHMSHNVMLAQKYRAHVVVTSGAESIWDMRAGRELASLAYMTGLDREKAVWAVSEVPGGMVRRISEIKDNILKNGVKVFGD